jgi:hypothetical protein
VRAEAAATRRANRWLKLRDVLYRRPLAFLTGSRYVPSPCLVNVGEVLQVMLDVHADEIFNHGVFNGAWAISLTSLHVCVYLQVGN